MEGVRTFVPGIQLDRRTRGVSPATCPGDVAIESRGDGRSDTGQFIQHRDQFCDQYELARLWAANRR